MEWFEKWFNKQYLELYSHRNSTDAEKQINLIIDTLNPSPSDIILDLACGEGRHCKILSDKGFNVKGLDLSDTLIKKGKASFPELQLNVGDMRGIDGNYDIILSLFTSFGYFEKHSDNEKVIASVYNALNPGGVYWLDFLNPVTVRRNLVPESSRKLKSGITVRELRTIKDSTVIKEIFFETGEHYIEKVRLYSEAQLSQMFTQAGFSVINCFGDYSGSKWKEGSERTILAGRK